MTETEIREVRELLSIRVGGKLRGLFYSSRDGLPKMALLSKDDILKKLGISKMEINSFEREGVKRLLGEGLASLRKQAKERRMPWIDYEVSADGKQIAYHGYDTDVTKIMANADKYDSYAISRKAIAKLTREIATSLTKTA